MKKLTLIKQVHQIDVSNYVCIIAILKMLDLNLNRMFVTNVMIFDDCL